MEEIYKKEEIEMVDEFRTFGGKRYYKAATTGLKEAKKVASDYRKNGFMARLTRRAHYSTIWTHNPRF